MSGQSVGGGERQGTFRDVFRHYAALIDTGHLQPGDRLPSYPSIEADHGVSHATVSKAMHLLKVAHYVQSTTAGMTVHLAGSHRLLRILCDTLNQLEESGHDVQLETSRGSCCIMTGDGGVCWNPDQECWETVTS